MGSSTEPCQQPREPRVGTERIEGGVQRSHRRAALKPLGMACGFHNHEREFATDGGTTHWDLFAERTTPT